MKQPTFFGRFLVWRLKHLSHRKFVLLLSIVLGILGGLAAIVLKNIVHIIQSLLQEGYINEYNKFLYLAFPLVGILITVFIVRFFVKDNIGHGITRILYAISKKKSRIRPHNMYTSMVGSTITVGFGGSVGLEAPIILTGAALGSNIGKWMRLNYKTTTLLIGCGSAAALAGIFKAPITAVLFALEVLMLDLTMWSIIPLLISSATGAMVAYFLLGDKVVFNFTVTDPLVFSNLHYFVLLGLIMGLISIYFVKVSEFIENQFRRIKNVFRKALIGGVLLGILIFLFPPLYGEGYEILRGVLGGEIEQVLQSNFLIGFESHYWYLIFFMIAIFMFKVLAMALTTGGGGVGGIFAPSLFIGGTAGFVFARILNRFPFINLSESNFGLVGMAGMIAGVMSAPLTAIFLIAEITGGYTLLVPLMLVAITSYLISMYFEPHSIYANRLAKRGELITHHKDKAVLTFLEVSKVLEKDFKTIHTDATLGELVKTISESKRNVFPVVSEDGVFLGIVLLDNIREIIFNPDLYKTIKVQDIMTVAPGYVTVNDTMESVMKKFEETGVWNMPVLKDDKYIGFISKSKIFSAYRKLLIDFSEE